MRKITLILLVLLLFPAVLIGWDYPDTMEANQDTQTIIELSKPLLQKENTLIIKWTGKLAGYTTYASFQRYFNELSNPFGFQANGELDHTNGLPVLRSTKQLINGALLQCMLVGSRDQESSILILKLTADSTVDYQKLVSFQHELQDKLRTLNLEGNWNTMIQGPLTISRVGDDPEVLLHTLSKEVQGIEQDLYVDANTLSSSLFTKKLKGSVRSGKHAVNLQIALHRNSISKEWRLTMGSPLITVEY